MSPRDKPIGWVIGFLSKTRDASLPSSRGRGQVARGGAIHAAEEAIADEAKKGYDMLLVGVEPALTVQGEIDEKVARVSEAFEGPLAIAVARGSDREEPGAGTHLNILVPVTGTEYSRPGAEVALTLARASLGSVTVLYVARGDGRYGGIAWPLTSTLIGEASVPTKKRSCARRPVRRPIRRAPANRGPRARRPGRGDPAAAEGR